MDFYIGLLKVIWIDVLLSGDNALVIAMACMGLAASKRVWGMILGAAAAVIVRIFFTSIITTLMEIPYLRAVSGLLLFVVAVKLLLPDDGDNKINQTDRLIGAVVTIVLADIVMSLDNIIAVAAAANGHYSLLIIGLAISIPCIVAGASVIALVLDKLPVLVWAGSALLGYLSGELVAGDNALGISHNLTLGLVGAASAPLSAWATHTINRRKVAIDG